MNITAALAYSQLIRKRSRTVITILVIALSTSLTTAVCSLVISANEMLIGMMGVDYASYGSTYTALLFIPAGVLGGLILAMSVIVISNVFRISAEERLSQFGTLKCVGATGRQIMETVMYECIFLSIIGIPAGILAGIVFTDLGARVANHYFDDLNSMVHMMMREITMSLEVVITWQALFLSAGISFITVLYSAYRPARVAAKKSAVACLKQTEVGEFIPARKEKENSSLLFGSIETGLALTNVRRNRKNTSSSIAVLSISIVLFIVLGSLQDIAARVEEYIYPNVDQTVIVDYTSNYDSRINPDTGRKEVWYANPIDSLTAMQIGEELKAGSDQNFISYGNDYDTYFAIVSDEIFTEDMKKAFEYEKINISDVNELEVEILSVDENLYGELCKRAGVEKGEAILLNSYVYNHKGTEKRIIPFSEEIETIVLETAEGVSREITVKGVLTTEEIPEDLFFLNTNPVRIVLPAATVRGYSWLSSPDDVEAYMVYARGVLEKYFPSGDSDEYMALGFSTRVYRVEDYARVMNIVVMIASVFLYSFVILLALIGMMNVVSTLSANVKMRSKEFAVLQSIGMTKKDLEKMLNRESLFCVGKALLYGLPVGVIFTLLLNYAAIQIMPIGFSIPWLSILLVVVAVFLIIWGTIHSTTKGMAKQNIIETIASSTV